MSTRIAYLCVIFIWSTTPLAIQWSSAGVGILFGVSARMLLGLFTAYTILYFSRQRFPWHSDALKTYLAAGLGIYTAMSCVYWASQYIPSGWISVVFGLSPIITGIMAYLVLREDALLPNKLLGMLLGVVGLLIIFDNSVESGNDFVLGVSAVLAGTICHSLSAVVIKRINARLSGIASTAGGLTLAVPMFLVTWSIFEGQMPVNIETRALYAILYLGIIASAIGFALYYYVLDRMEVSRVSLITLITPACALGLGKTFNGEIINPLIITGTVVIILGLVIYEYGQKFTGYLIKD